MRTRSAIKSARCPVVSERRSQLAAKVPRRAERTFPVSDTTARRPRPHPALLGRQQSYGGRSDHGRGQQERDRHPRRARHPRHHVGAPNGHDAEVVRDGLIATISTLPTHLRGSLTWDQVAEMARHKQFSMATDMAVYFCDPASPWQRGTNENTNGLLRQYFPKGTDLSAFAAEDLEHVAQQHNGRPRKTLDGNTPAERLRDRLTTE